MLFLNLLLLFVWVSVNLSQDVDLEPNVANSIFGKVARSVEVIGKFN